MTTLTPEQYYQDTDYLSNSSLSNFVSFDIFGIPSYSMQEFLNPTQPDSMAILIGQVFDKILTENYDMDSEYGPQLDKAGMQNELDMMGIEYKKADTNPVLRKLLEDAGYEFKKEMPKPAFDAINKMLHRANNFQYDSTTTFQEFIAECDCQKICVSDEWGVRGKFDFLNRKRKIIADLKTTGQLDRVLKELLYKGKPNIYHKYVRQLAIYQHLYFLETGEKFSVELIFIDYKGHHRVIPIGQRALDKSLAQVMKDIEVLRSMFNSERKFNEVYDIDEEDVARIDSHTAPVMEAVAEEEATDNGPDFLTSFV